jgi:hypothetical protein
MMTEQELFNFINKDNKYVLSTEQFSNWDCYSDELREYVELKCRKTHYDDLLIEKIKYDRIVKIAAEKGMTPKYVNYTPKGIWSFKLKDFNITWEDRSGLPATTDFANKMRVTKTVGYLNVSNGEQLWKAE